MIAQRILLRQLRSNGVHISLRRRHRNFWFESSENSEPSRRAVLKRSRAHSRHSHGLQRNRQVYFGLELHAGASELSRRHAGDGERVTVEHDTAAEDCRGTSERTLPERIAEHRNGLTAGDIVLNYDAARLGKNP